MARLGRGQSFKPLVQRVRGTMSFSSTLTEAVTTGDTLLRTIGRTLSDAMLFGPPVNGIRNNSMQGAVVGTPGTKPTNWNFGGLAGLSSQIVAIGTDIDGIDYIDVRYYGTTNATGGYFFVFESTSAIASAQNQTWTESAYIAVVAGTTANLTNFAFDAVSYPVGNDNGGSNFLSSLTSTLQRFSFTVTIPQAANQFIQPRIVFGCNNASAVDVTFRVGWPQMERASAASPPIRTAGFARGQESLIREPSRTLTDAVTISDFVLKIGGKLLTDAIVASDALLRTIGRTLSDAVTSTDALIRDITRLFAEAAIASDTLLKTLGRTLTDAATITDTLLRTIARNCSEAISATDILVRDIVRTFFEAVTSTDTAIKTAGRTLADTATLSDSRLLTTSRILAEAVVLTDTVLKSASRALLDAVTATDTLVHTVSRALTDAVAITGTLLRTAGRTLSEAATVTDYFAYRFLTKMRRGIALLRTTMGKLVLKSKNSKIIL
ncbi:MAG: hypothetical protein AAB403_03715 [Planctomycetota bacterium]